MQEHTINYAKEQGTMGANDSGRTTEYHSSHATCGTVCQPSPWGECAKEAHGNVEASRFDLLEAFGIKTLTNQMCLTAGIPPLYDPDPLLFDEEYEDPVDQYLIEK